MSYYGKLSSEVYDMDKPIGHSFGDVEYYMDRLKDCKGPILEPATGTGRILIPLLESGLKVDGFDISRDMLDKCNYNCEKRGLKTRIFQAEMENFTSEVEYEAIIVPTGTFLLLHERESSLAALKNFHKNLVEGGKLIVDIFLQMDIAIGKIETKEFHCSNGDLITLESKIVKVDHINQYTISHSRYEKWSDGTLKQTELEHFPLRWYGLEEFKLILESIGFGEITISSNYQFGRYPTQADSVITFEAIALKNPKVKSN